MVSTDQLLWLLQIGKHILLSSAEVFCLTWSCYKLLFWPVSSRAKSPSPCNFCWRGSLFRAGLPQAQHVGGMDAAVDAHTECSIGKENGWQVHEKFIWWLLPWLNGDERCPLTVGLSAHSYSVRLSNRYKIYSGLRLLSFRY